MEGATERGRLKRARADQQAALAVFARVLVHDMKAPTQSILGFAKLVEVFLSQENYDRDKIIALSRRIAEGAMRMNSLLDQLHAYTEADVTPQFENIPLEELAGDVIANLDAVIAASGARIVHEELPMICGDRTQLVQLLQNLVGNGMKYCRDRTPEVRILAEEQTNGTCIVEVRDNGIGIPEHHYTTIFEPFKRLHSQGEFEGTGLGLATCKKIVEQHGGAIWCKSEVGQGTSFFFTVPLVERERHLEASGG